MLITTSGAVHSSVDATLGGVLPPKTNAEELPTPEPPTSNLAVAVLLTSVQVVPFQNSVSAEIGAGELPEKTNALVTVP